METPDWTALLARIVPRAADDLDDVVGPFDPRRGPSGRDVFPDVDAVLLPQAALKRADAVCVGVKAPAAVPDAADLAMRLAAFMAERTVEVIVLAEVDATGLEGFGFRIERVPGASDAARAQWERQVRRFWNLDLVL